MVQVLPPVVAPTFLVECTITVNGTARRDDVDCDTPWLWFFATSSA